MATNIITDGITTTSTQVPESTTTLNLSLVTDDPGKGSLILNETITDLNVTTVEYIPIVAAACTFATLLSIGALAVTIFIVVLVRGRKRFQEFPFFAIVHHLTAANALHVFMQLATVIPIMVFENDANSANRHWYKIGSYVIMITEQAALYFTLLMTVNRFAVFVYPSWLAVFSTKGIHIISANIWILVNFIVFWNYNYGTIKTFSKEKLKVEDVLFGTNILSQIFMLLSTFLPLVMLGLYVLICCMIFKKRQVVVNSKKSDRDKSLVLQALLVTVALEVVNITDVLTPYLADTSKTVQWIWTIFCYCVTICNQMINPLLFLTVNRMVRGVARHVFSKNLTTNFLSDNTSTVQKQQGESRVAAAPAIVKPTPRVVAATPRSAHPPNIITF